jgi:antitoxin HigA-1
VRRATFSDLLNEKTTLTPEKTFNLNMNMLLRMQAWYDASKMRKQAGTINITPYVPAPM